MIRVAHLASSIIENTCWEGKSVFSEKLLGCGLKEGIKAVLFVLIRFHGSSMVKRYGYLFNNISTKKILTLI
jgi:hypothetical protein